MKTLKQLKQINESSRYAIDEFLNVDELLIKLEGALAEEFTAWYMYVIVTPYLAGVNRQCVIDFFKEAAKDELEDHAYWLMERISQLGGCPKVMLNSCCLDAAAKHKFIQQLSCGDCCNINILTALKNNVTAEKAAIETYKDIEIFTRDRDVVTNKKIKEILADEMEHLQELEDFIVDLEGDNCCCCQDKCQNTCQNTVSNDCADGTLELSIGLPELEF